MVNTFVPYKSFKKSAHSLDTPRLRKQIVEAYQILRIIIHLTDLAELMGETLPPHDEKGCSISQISSNFAERCKFVKEIRRKYLAKKYRYFRMNPQPEGERSPDESVTSPEYQKVSVNSLPFRIPPGPIRFRLSRDGSRVKFSPSKPVLSDPIISTIEYSIDEEKDVITLPRERVCLPTDDFITLGFSQHPAVPMWFGHVPSLKNYIHHLHLAYEKRKTRSGGRCSSSVPRYSLTPGAVKPWWITHTDVVRCSHRASLLRKETERIEDDWYSLNLDFTEGIPKEYHSLGYVWPTHLLGKIEAVCNGFYNYEDVCDRVAKSAPLKEATIQKRKKRKRQLLRVERVKSQSLTGVLKVRCRLLPSPSGVF